MRALRAAKVMRWISLKELVGNELVVPRPAGICGGPGRVMVTAQRLRLAGFRALDFFEAGFPKAVQEAGFSHEELAEAEAAGQRRPKRPRQCE